MKKIEAFDGNSEEINQLIPVMFLHGGDLNSMCMRCEALETEMDAETGINPEIKESVLEAGLERVSI